MRDLKGVDIVAILNALHGMFLFGVAVRGTTRPKILYFSLNIFIQSFMAVCSIAVALMAFVRLISHGWCATSVVLFTFINLLLLSFHFLHK